jgi:hypothetical protein
MPKLTANPNVEVNSAFDVVKPGVYKMRVKEIEEFTANSGNTCWRLRAEYAEPSSLDKVDGTGPANNPGTILDSGLVIAPADKQGKLRGMVEACGVAWANLDSDDLIGKEFDAKVGTKEYNGELKNVIKRYLKQK